MSEQPSENVRGWKNVSSEKFKPKRDGVGSYRIELFIKTLELTERALRIKRRRPRTLLPRGRGGLRRRSWEDTMGGGQKGGAEPVTSLCPSVLPKPTLVFLREVSYRELAT